MFLRKLPTEKSKADWKSVTVIRVQEALGYLENAYVQNSRELLGSDARNCCMDEFRNQSVSCDCVYALVKKGRSRDWNERVDYEIICQEITKWYGTAGEIELLRLTGRLSQNKWMETFRQCIALKRSIKGTYTRMVDMSIMPTWKSTECKDYDEEAGLDLYENLVISESTLCLNSVLHIWCHLAGGDFGGRSGSAQFHQWRSQRYDVILRWNAKMQEDVSTQVRKQRLFYARIEDFLQAKGQRERVSFKCAQDVFQSKYNLNKTEKSTKHWRKRQVNFWTRWNLSSIHILQSKSEMLYNVKTRDLVGKLNIAVGRVEDATTDVLRELAEELESMPKSWSRVSQDKKLWYFPFDNSHDVTSAMQLYFGTLGVHTNGNRMKKMLKDKDFVQKIKDADANLKEVFLEMLNRGKDEHSKYTNVAFQPSAVMSKVHFTQDAHWDYKREGGLQDKYMVAFLPVTTTGQFLQVWEYDRRSTNTDETVEGNILFIPKSEMTLMRGNVLHGGGFRAEARSDQKGGHLRFHFYVYPGEETCQISKHCNENHDHRGRVNLAKRYVDNPLLQGRLDSCETGYDSLGWTFFQGRCPMNESTGHPKKRKHVRQSRKRKKTSVV
jgi:hypothetical protein